MPLLDQYLTEQKITDEAFGAAIGVSKMSVGRYRRGQAMPRPRVAARIVRETGGQVTLADLHRAVVDGLNEGAAA